MSKDTPLPRVVSGDALSVMGTQAVITVLGALGFFLLAGSWAALSVGYGGLVAMVLAFLLGRRIVRAGEVAGQSCKRGMLILFAGLAQRFALVLVLMGVGLAVFKLHPLAAVTGFALAQLGYLIMGMRNIKL